MKKAKKDMAKKIYGMVQDTFVDGEDFAVEKGEEDVQGLVEEADLADYLQPRVHTKHSKFF